MTACRSLSALSPGAMAALLSYPKVNSSISPDAFSQNLFGLFISHHLNMLAQTESCLEAKIWMLGFVSEARPGIF